MVSEARIQAQAVSYGAALLLCGHLLHAVITAETAAEKPCPPGAGVLGRMSLSPSEHSIENCSSRL